MELIVDINKKIIISVDIVIIAISMFYALY